ncbi:hypothetical protein NLU13_6673 [Sarocladium strictum]|uniref:NmrA-like domain-containing protein n=1 Tax=Sarocladium strictum TaxID=5046 RepID=A0AA39GDT3_SARSR|nr:hypothetical protein NLU13_6673 [Sarocladium strictum]
MSRVFLTGASGYIGGQVLHALVNAHPELTIRALVRDLTKGEAITTAYPNVQIVEGSLDDESVLSKEASDASVVLHLAATGHLKSVETIHKALQNRSGKPARWIQISGASLLAADELADSTRVPGSPSDLIFDDLDGVAAIHSLIKKHPSRAVDNYLLSVAESTPQVKTALVVPPIIYGPGQGPVNQRSVQIPSLAKATLERGKGLQVGQGLSRWSNVHIQDLGQLFVLLVKAALSDQATEGLWGLNGIYLTGTGELPFGDISSRVASFAAEQGWIANRDVDEVLGDEANNLLPHSTVLYGTNARSKARRAIERLGWRPQHVNGLEAEIPRAVTEEARALGKAA